MAPTSLESAWRKWAWASLHAERLKADIDAALNPEIDPPVTITHKYEPKLKGFTITVLTVHPLPTRWGLMFGDVIHTYRSALDHLAWFLIQRGRRAGKVTEPEARKVYFPIYDDRASFNKAVAYTKGKPGSTGGNVLPGVRRTDLAIVRQYQPCYRGKRTAPRYALTILYRLEAIDKHRIAQPVWPRLFYQRYDVTDAIDCIPTRVRVLPPKPLEIGTELARVYVRRTGPDPDIEVKGQQAFDVTLDDVIWVKNACNAMQSLIVEMLTRFEPPPADLLERLTQWSKQIAR